MLLNFSHDNLVLQCLQSVQFGHPSSYMSGRLLEPARDYAQTIAKLRLRYSHRTAGKLHKAAIAGAI